MLHSQDRSTRNHVSHRTGFNDSKSRRSDEKFIIDDHSPPSGYRRRDDSTRKPCSNYHFDMSRAQSADSRSMQQWPELRQSPPYHDDFLKKGRNSSPEVSQLIQSGCELHVGSNSRILRSQHISRAESCSSGADHVRRADRQNSDGYREDYFDNYFVDDYYEFQGDENSYTSSAPVAAPRACGVTAQPSGFRGDVCDRTQSPARAVPVQPSVCLREVYRSISPARKETAKPSSSRREVYRPQSPARAEPEQQWTGRREVSNRTQSPVRAEPAHPSSGRQEARNRTQSPARAEPARPSSGRREVSNRSQSPARAEPAQPWTGREVRDRPQSPARAEPAHPSSGRREVSNRPQSPDRATPAQPSGGHREVSDRSVSPDRALLAAVFAETVKRRREAASAWRTERATLADASDASDDRGGDDSEPSAAVAAPRSPSPAPAPVAKALNRIGQAGKSFVSSVRGLLS